MEIYCQPSDNLWFISIPLLKIINLLHAIKINCKEYTFANSNWQQTREILQIKGGILNDCVYSHDGC